MKMRKALSALLAVVLCCGLMACGGGDNNVVVNVPETGNGLPAGCTSTVGYSPITGESCSGNTGGITCSVTVSEGPGQSSTLTWSSTNAASFEFDQGIGLVTPVSGGSIVVSPVQSTWYTGTAKRPGTEDCEITLLVSGMNNPPTIVIAPSLKGKYAPGTGVTIDEEFAIYVMNGAQLSDLRTIRVFNDLNGDNQIGAVGSGMTSPSGGAVSPAYLENIDNRSSVIQVVMRFHPEGNFDTFYYPDPVAMQNGRASIAVDLSYFTGDSVVGAIQVNCPTTSAENLYIQLRPDKGEDGEGPGGTAADGVVVRSYLDPSMYTQCDKS